MAARRRARTGQSPTRRQSTAYLTQDVWESLGKRGLSPQWTDLPRRVAAEAMGTAFLLMAIVGSGIMAGRLLDGDPGLTLLVNSVATGSALFAIIVAFGPISGSHINPAVTLSFTLRKSLTWGESASYLLAQVAGALVGVALANVMFREPAFVPASTIRGEIHEWAAEFVATFGLVAVIFATKRHGALVVGPAVGFYITSAYWFTPSTSFANPAVTVARALTDTFSGIHPANVFGFVLAQCLGAIAATAVFAWLLPCQDFVRVSRDTAIPTPLEKEIA